MATTTYNPADATINAFGTATFSNGNLTFDVAGNASAIMLARCKGSQTTGKYYFEATLVATDNNQFVGNGIIQALPTSIGTAVSAAYVRNGTWFANGTSGAMPASYTTGDVIGCAVDLATTTIWWRKGIVWGPGATPDPALGLGGTSFANATGAITPFSDLSGNGAPNGTWTMNFGASSYAQTPPSGFTNWTVPDTAFISEMFFAA